MNKNNQRLSDLLQSYVTKQEEKNSKLSESQISEQLDIPASTFNRLINRQSQPSLETLIKLSKFIPEVKEFLPSEMFEVVLEKTSGERLGKKLEVLLSDPDMFLIYALAFSDKGITEDFIIKNLGSTKIKKLQILEKEGFIERKGNGLGIYKVTTQKQITSSFQLIKKHIDILNKFYRPDQPEKNYAFYAVDRLNERGVSELMRANKEFHGKVADIMNKKENKGDISVFSTGLSDILFDDQISKEEEGKNEYN